MWVIAVLFLTCTVAWATSRDVLPQTSHGLTVTATRSDASGATLVVRSNGQTEMGEADRPFSSGVLWALPGGTGEVQITVGTAQWRAVNAGEVPDSIATQVLSDPKPLVRASAVMTMRGMNFTSLAINALQPSDDGQSLRVCEQCDFDVRYVGNGRPLETRKLSRSFYDLARGVAANLDEVVPEPEAKPEAYLIITPPAYVGAALSSFVNWKRARGHTVRVATTDQTGTTNQQIKSYIQNAYNTLEEPPVFVMLIGDVDGTSPLASWLVPGFYHPWNVSDHPYTLLDGTDWLPDVFIGRLSVDSGQEFQTVINKCVSYESQPYQPQGAWRSRLLITGVRSSPSFYPTYNSSWPTLQWIGRQFLEHGYTELDSVPAPPGNASQISSAINAGVSFVAYRGFGAPDAWDFPYYAVSNVTALTNGQMLPVVTSIVCGGGAFDSSVDPCLGEAFLRAGTPTNPRGAIGFIGPSELDTKTRWNNTNVAGIYEGIIFENVQTLGAAMLRGKLELMREFPNNVDNQNADPNRSVSFYFYCYNLLGDPGLTFFVGPARNLTATLPDTLPAGTPTLSFQAAEDGEPLAGAWATVKTVDSVFSRAVSDSAGNVILTLPQTTSGDVQVTLTKPRYEPHLYTLNISPRASSVASRALLLVDNGTHGSTGNGDGIPDAGERLAFAVVLHNYGTVSFSAGTLSFVSQSTAVSVVDNSVPIPALAPGAESDTLFLTADVAVSCGDGQTGRLTWSINPGNFTWDTPLDIHAPHMSVTTVRTDGVDGNPAPNSTARVALGLTNLGRSTLPASTVVLRSRDPRLTVTDSSVSYSMILPGQTVLPVGQGFQVHTGAFYPGDWAQTDVIASGGGISSPVSFALPIGNLQGSDPSHPDGYGYRAFQSSDTGYAEAPAYAWMEIDPSRGGPGTVLNIPDGGGGQDTTVRIALPFDFSFYGVSYDHLSVCSNGFVSFGLTSASFFRNYSLPAIASPDNMVCVFWDDLAMIGSGHVCTYNDVEGGRFVIEWSHVTNEFDNTEETFQLMLYDTSCWRTRTGDGDLLMQYQNFNNADSWDNYSTIGIQDKGQGYALQLTYANQWSPGMSLIRSQHAILVTTGRPQGVGYFGYAGNVVDDDSLNGSQGNHNGVPQNGETIQLSIRLQNTGASTATAQSGTLRSTDPYVLRLDSALTFPPIAPGDTAVSNAVRVRLLPSAPDGHVSNFAVRFSGDATPCMVLPALRISGPALAGMPPLMDDDSVGASRGNNNHEFNPGETIELTPGASNTGGNLGLGVRAVLRYSGNRITILDSVAYFGTVPQDSLRYATDSFVFRVSQVISDGEPFVLQIVLTDSFGTAWPYSVNYLAMRPGLALDGLRIADPAPGGNGDGHLNLGEQGEIYPRIINNGLGQATNVTVRLRSLDSLFTLLDSTVYLGTISGNSTRESAAPIRVSVSPNGSEPRNVPIDVTILSGSVQSTEQTVVMIGRAALFDDFETSTAYWSVYGTPSIWHVQNRESYSPTHAFYCGSETTHLYSDGADTYLRSPAFTFSGTGALIFRTRYTMADAADVCHVQLQTGPSTYQMLTQFSGTSDGWEERRISLSGLPAYDGAQLRFWFSSDAQGQAEGWYIDDVVVLEEDLPVSDTPTALQPERFELAQNFPNPFNDQTTIQYSVPRASRVKLTLYDLEGRKVATLVDEVKPAGMYHLSWRPIGLASGVYFVRLDAPDVHLTGKIAYLK
jgi:hypothetical protein